MADPCSPHDLPVAWRFFAPDLCTAVFFGASLLMTPPASEVLAAAAIGFVGTRAAPFAIGGLRPFILSAALGAAIRTAPAGGSGLTAGAESVGGDLADLALELQLDAGAAKAAFPGVFARAFPFPCPFFAGAFVEASVLPPVSAISTPKSALRSPPAITRLLLISFFAAGNPSPCFRHQFRVIHAAQEEEQFGLRRDARRCHRAPPPHACTCPPSPGNCRTA